MSSFTNGLSATDWSAPDMQARVRKRYAAERRFRLYGYAAIGFAALALVTLLGSIVIKGLTGFVETQIQVTLNFDEGIFPVGPEATPEARDQAIRSADYARIIRDGLRERFPDVTSRGDVRALTKLVSMGATSELRDMVLADPSLIGTTRTMWILGSGDLDTFYKGDMPRDIPETDRRIKDNQLIWIDALTESGEIRSAFAWNFFTHGDSREPEMAGILGAMVGSALTLLVTLLVAFPLGVAAAIYLEEYAPKNRITDIIEININNLAAVPSIVFGLLGLAMFLNVFGMPRSAPLVGGLTLALMTLPTVIIAGRAAMTAVPPSIRDAARGVGASDNQVVFHHVLPLALPGIFTGTIIGMARALGESAPLLMIGMVAFVVDIPGGINDPSTVLPVQVYLWADSPERAFVAKTSAAIIVLLAFLVLMNGLAAWLRKRFEVTW